MSLKFKQLAHQKAIFVYLQQHLTDQFLSGSDSKVLESDDLPRAEATVSDDAISDVILRLQQEELILSEEMNRTPYERQNVRRIGSEPSSFDSSAEDDGPASSR